MNIRTIINISAAGVLAFASATSMAADPVKNIVLVHGAWADGSCWNKVIPLLEERGLHVVSVQNPLSSLADDVAATKRVIDAQNGPVVLVGHSYGGAVVSVAGNNPNVTRIVYVAAFAPDTGESVATTAKNFATPPGNSEVTPIEDGFVVLTHNGIFEDFAQDTSKLEKHLLEATEGPTSGSVFTATQTDAAWRARPTWYIVAEYDRMINPDYERFAAKRMGAKTISLPTSHVPMLSKPKEVAEFIASAAGL